MQNYILESIFWSALFYLGYRLLMARTTFYRYNRFYLIMSMLMTALLPLIKLKRTVYLPIQKSFSSAPIGTTENIAQVASRDYLSLFFWAIALIFTLVFLFRSLALVRLIKQSKLMLQLRLDPFLKLKVKAHYKPLKAFSFWNQLVLSYEDYKSTGKAHIMAHEMAHIEQYHSLDLILAQVYLIFNWFNPFAYLLRKAMLQNLEYLADQQAIGQIDQEEIKDYQYQLVQYAADFQTNSFAGLNGFAAGSIKHRIKHINTEKSKPMNKIKYLIVFAIAAVAFTQLNIQTTYAQEKQSFLQERHEVKLELITKDFSKDQLNELVARMSKEGLTIKYSGLKYNDAQEIVKLSLSAQYNDNKTSANWSGSKAIPNIEIGFEDDQPIINASLAKPALFEVAPHASHGMAVFIDENGESTSVTLDGENKWESKDGKHVIVTVDSDMEFDEEIEVTSPNVWVSKENDSIHIVKKVRIIEINEDDISETVESGTKKIKIMTTDSKAKPLIILDGVEVPNKSMDDIDPDNIKSINVIKGEKAEEKYGEKAKNGVVEITTKD
ncbi:MAG: M56 family metallopeptidase [Flavobacteriaceae bacterium]